MQPAETALTREHAAQHRHVVVDGDQALPYVDLAVVGHHDEGGVFSWWDYRAAGFRRNLGLRIDLCLVSDALKPRCVGAGIDREPREWDRPSDHAPAIVQIAR